MTKKNDLPQRRKEREEKKAVKFIFALFAPLR